MLSLVWMNFVVSTGALRDHALRPPTLTSVTAPVDLSSGLVQPRDPHTGTQVRVITMASVTYVPVMINFMSHMEYMLPAVPLEIYALDEATYTLCRNGMLSERGQSCVYSPPVSILGKDEHGINMQHRWKLIHSLLFQNQTVVLLDATALLLQPACFWEMLATDGALVASTGATCPTEFAERFFCVFNLGIALWRPIMEPVVRELVDRTGKIEATRDCPNQTFLHELMLQGGFHWEDSAMSSQMCKLHGGTGHFDFGGQALDVVALNRTGWRRDSKQDGACAFHPFMVDAHAMGNEGSPNHRRVFMEAGLWYNGKIN